MGVYVEARGRGRGLYKRTKRKRRTQKGRKGGVGEDPVCGRVFFSWLPTPACSRKGGNLLGYMLCCCFLLCAVLVVQGSSVARLLLGPWPLRRSLLNRCNRRAHGEPALCGGGCREGSRPVPQPAQPRATVEGGEAAPAGWPPHSTRSGTAHRTISTTSSAVATLARSIEVILRHPSMRR